MISHVNDPTEIITSGSPYILFYTKKNRSTDNNSNNKITIDTNTNKLKQSIKENMQKYYKGIVTLTNDNFPQLVDYADQKYNRQIWKNSFEAEPINYTNNLIKETINFITLHCDTTQNQNLYKFYSDMWTDVLNYWYKNNKSVYKRVYDITQNLFSQYNIKAKAPMEIKNSDSESGAEYEEDEENEESSDENNNIHINNNKVSSQFNKNKINIRRKYSGSEDEEYEKEYNNKYLKSNNKISDKKLSNKRKTNNIKMSDEDDMQFEDMLHEAEQYKTNNKMSLKTNIENNTNKKNNKNIPNKKIILKEDVNKQQKELNKDSTQVNDINILSIDKSSEDKLIKKIEGNKKKLKEFTIEKAEKDYPQFFIIQKNYEKINYPKSYEQALSDINTLLRVTVDFMATYLIDENNEAICDFVCKICNLWESVYNRLSQSNVKDSRIVNLKNKIQQMASEGHVLCNFEILTIDKNGDIVQESDSDEE